MTTQTLLQRLSPQDGDILHVETSAEQRIEVREFASLRWLTFGGNAMQSVMCVDTPELPLQPYNIAMLAALLFQPRPKRLLNLGFGGGTFERFFRTHYPDLSLTSVESNAAVIRLAKRHFQIPEDYPVIHESAEDFLAGDRGRYHMVFCDIFDANYHPRCLFDHRFYLQALRHLKADGVFAVNLLPATTSELLQIVQAVRQHFPWTLQLDFPDHHNSVLFGLRQEAPDTAELEKMAAVLSTKTGLNLTSIPARLKRFPLQAFFG